MTDQVRYLVELRPARKGERVITGYDGADASLDVWCSDTPSSEAWPVVVGESREDRPQPRRSPWPAPKPGTHESDLHCAGLITARGPEIVAAPRGGSAEFQRARAWSRANAPKATQ